ncbi:MAG TPA: T9SS type A sorting domain-containing protein, partial [Bacteroidetes bacterium]|nr:T9SS type A sorting domain-containing protein [Bacteroidota bacterium]
PGLYIYGLGWLDIADDDYNLYLFCRDGPDHSQVHRMNSETGEIQFLLDLPSDFDERAGGFAVTSNWEPRYWSAIAQFSGGSNRTIVYNLKSRRDWARLTPRSASIQPARSLPVWINFDARGFHNGQLLEGFITIDGHQRGGIDTIHVAMRISENGVFDRESPELSPEDFNISAYPNPFNDQLTVRYRAPIGLPVKVSIYDVQGRSVKTVTTGIGDGMTNTAVFQSGSLGSGLYFIALEAGSGKYLSRAVLLK